VPEAGRGEIGGDAVPPIAYWRLGVTATSITGSSSPAQGAKAAPTGAGRGSSLCLHARRQFELAHEHIMPRLSTRGSAPLEIRSLPGT